MYAKGMTTRDISEHLKSVYEVDASAEMISHMTDRILPIAKEWQNRPLEKKYAVVFMDAIHFHVRQDNQTIKKAVYIAIGVQLSRTKEVFGMLIGGNESAKYWLGVLNEMKNRGVEDIMIVSVDGLTGFGDAISRDTALYHTPDTLFPTDDFLFKSLYLAMIDITKNGQEKAGTGGQT